MWRREGTRGTGHDEHARYTEDAATWHRMMDRLKRKYEMARKLVPASVLHKLPGATAGILAFGSTEAAVLEARHQLATEHDLKADFLRVRALPFTDDVREFVEKYDVLYVVDMNRDGQMAQLLHLEYPEQATKFRSVAHGDGLPAAASWIREGILAQRADAGKTGKSRRAVIARKAPRSKAKAAVKRKTASRARRK